MLGFQKIKSHKTSVLSRKAHVVITMWFLHKNNPLEPAEIRHFFCAVYLPFNLLIRMSLVRVQLPEPKISRFSGIFLYFHSGNLFLYKTHKNVKKGHFYPCFLIKIHQNTQNTYEKPPLHFYKYVFLSDGFFYDLYIDFYVDFY